MGGNNNPKKNKKQKIQNSKKMKIIIKKNNMCQYSICLSDTCKLFYVKAHGQMDTPYKLGIIRIMFYVTILWYYKNNNVIIFIRIIIYVQNISLTYI